MFNFFFLISNFFLISFVSFLTSDILNFNISNAEFFIISIFLAIVIFGILKLKFFENIKNYIIITIFISIFLGTLIENNKQNIVYFWIKNSLDEIKSSRYGFEILKIKWMLQGYPLKLFDTSEKYIRDNIKINNHNNKILLNLDYSEPYIINKNGDLIKIPMNTNNGGIIHFDKNEFIFYSNNNGKQIGKYSLSNDYNEVNEIWSLEGKYFFHHWGDVHKNNLYIPGRKFSNKRNKFFKACKANHFIEDVIYIIDYKNGSLIRTIDVSNKFINSRYNPKKCRNPLHLNDIRVIKSVKHKDFFKNYKVEIGDLLLSFKNINTIAVYSVKKDKVLWSYSNNGLVEQHSPRITDNGTILVFNNYGSDKFGFTRIDEIEIEKKKIVGIYDGSPTNHLNTASRGRIQLFQKEIYIQESTKSKVTKIKCIDKYISNINCIEDVIIDFKDYRLQENGIFRSFVIELID